METKEPVFIISEAISPFQPTQRTSTRTTNSDVVQSKSKLLGILHDPVFQVPCVFQHVCNARLRKQSIVGDNDDPSTVNEHLDWERWEPRASRATEQTTSMVKDECFPRPFLFYSGVVDDI